MNEKELKNLLDDPKRILNLARVFHQLLHQIDKMEEQKAKEQPKPMGGQKAQIKDKLEVVLKGKEGNVKAQFKSN